MSCRQCGTETLPGWATCGNSACQQTESACNEARAHGLKVNGEPRKGWDRCHIPGCRTPFRHDTLAEPFCPAHIGSRVTL